MTWLDLRPDDAGWGLDNLPYGVFSTRPDGLDRRVGVAVGRHVLDLAAVAEELWPAMAGTFAESTLDRFMAGGRAVWDETRERVTGWLTDGAHERAARPHLVGRDEVRLHLPFTVADYVDFYASEHHATNLGRMFRPGQEPLTPNWRHLPIGYHGRAGTVVVSGTPVVRPHGQRRTPDGDIVFGPSTRLDIEAELGFVVGAPSVSGTPVPMEEFAEHVFGACLVNDWSARDIQSWEYVPLGPFLGKSFATSVSPWLVPLAALEHARVEPPARDPKPLPYLDDADTGPWGFDIRLEVRLNGHVVSRPPFAGMYWTAAQQLAHMTVNGAGLRTGDLFASGTISGPGSDERGSLIELSWSGETPIELPDGSRRTFLEDGDEVVITATAPASGGGVVAFGEVRGTVMPPHSN